MVSPSLHEFMSSHRGELVAMASQRIKEHSPELRDDEVGRGLMPIMDEIVGARS